MAQRSNCPLTHTLLAYWRKLLVVPVVCRVSLLGLVFHVDLFPPDVLLDDLCVLDDLFADADLLLDHRSLLDLHLFLDHGHHYLVFPDLRPSGLPLGRGDCLPLDGDTLHRYFHTLLCNRNPLAIGPHALAHPYGTSLALAGLDPELLLRASHPKLFFVLEDTRLGYALPVVLASADPTCLGRDSRARASALPLGQLRVATIVSAVAALVVGILRNREPVVTTHPLLELGRYLLVIPQARPGLHHSLGARHHHAPQPVIDRDDVCRDEGRPGS